jgi:hyperosmotically inducible periplasmic protein
MVNKVARLTLVALLGVSSLALAEETTTKTETETKIKKKKTSQDVAKADDNADNTKRNKRDRSDAEPTADQQRNMKSDLEVTQQIRKSIMDDKALSTYAHNVKIIAQNGTVTLKGPVRSMEEKTTIEQKAAEAVGKANVKSEIEIKP